MALTQAAPLCCGPVIPPANWPSSPGCPVHSSDQYVQIGIILPQNLLFSVNFPVRLKSSAATKIGISKIPSLPYPCSLVRCQKFCCFGILNVSLFKIYVIYLWSCSSLVCCTQNISFSDEILSPWNTAGDHNPILQSRLRWLSAEPHVVFIFMCPWLRPFPHFLPRLRDTYPWNPF